jgi:hypothetical protein
MTAPAAEQEQRMRALTDSACSAAMAGDLSALQGAIAQARELGGPLFAIDGEGSRGRSPLYQACLGRQPEAARWLLEQGAVDTASGDAYLAICAAGRGGVEDANPGERTAAIMREFGFTGKKQKKKKKQKQGGSPKAGKGIRPAQQMDAALVAASKGDFAPLLARGGAKGSKQSELPLHFAAKTKNAEAVRQLLVAEVEGQLLSPGKQGRTPLHYAVQSRDATTVEALLQQEGQASTAATEEPQHGGGRGLRRQHSGEALLRADERGKLPLHYALEQQEGKGVPVALALLKAAGQEKKAAGKLLMAAMDPKSGELPLHCAARAGRGELVEAMLRAAEAGAPPQLRVQQLMAADAQGSLPLHHAVRGGHAAAVHALSAEEAALREPAVSILESVHID